MAKPAPPYEFLLWIPRSSSGLPSRPVGSVTSPDIDSADQRSTLAPTHAWTSSGRLIPIFLAMGFIVPRAGHTTVRA